MAVPVGVIELHEAHSTFDQATGQETVGGKGCFPGFYAIAVEGVLLLLAEVHEFRCARLHAVGHLIGIETGKNLGVTCFLESGAIEGAHGVVKLALACAGHSFRAA